MQTLRAEIEGNGGSNPAVASRTERILTHGSARKAALPVCPLCGAARNMEAFREQGYSLRHCQVCELFFIHPYPAGGEQHQRVLNYSYEEIHLLDPEQSYRGEVLYYKRHFPLIAEECSQAGSVLDVGCGAGHLLERLSHFPQLRRVGIELNSQRAEYARKVAHCEIHQVALERFRTEEKFDVVTMINVLSHIPSFDNLFHPVRALLRPRGRLILRTSEMDRGVHRWSQFSWGIPDDLHFLGMGTLDFICQKYGWKICRRLRTAYADEVFLRDRWKQPGRSHMRNFVKSGALVLPFALPAIKKCYEMLAGQHLCLSFIVLTPQVGGSGLSGPEAHA